MGAVVHGIQVIVNLITLFALFASLSAASGAIDPASRALVIFILAVYVILELFLIAAFVLTCMTFGYIGADHEKYNQKKGVTIATIVFNFIVAILFFVACAGTANAGSIVFFIICALVLIAANVLYILDLSSEKKRAEEQQAKLEEPQPEDIQQ